MSTRDISILIATMQRPQMLGRLLVALDALACGDDTTIEVIVVDNDPERSARATCDAHGKVARWPLRYVEQPERGIPHARNAAVAALRPEADFAVFIDDDEVPGPGWLEALLAVQAHHDADVVAGPVASILPEEAPRWATAGKIFDHTRHATGTSIRSCGTNNVLIRTTVFARVTPWFDPRLALAGGSDRHFFLRVHDAGFRMVWADDALVHEEVPASRVRLGWVMRRMYWQGVSNAFCEVDLGRGPLPRARMTARGLAFLGLGAALTPLGAALGSHRLVQFARYSVYGAGLLAGTRGRLYDEYRVIHGA